MFIATGLQAYRNRRQGSSQGGKALALTGLVAVMLLIGTTDRAEAQFWSSSRLLLPYFEVDMEQDGTTTLLAVVNTSDEPVLVEATLYSNWGIEILATTFELEARAARTYNLTEWLKAGVLPDRQLTPSELEHVAAALCGQRSLSNELYYSTEVMSDLDVPLAVGYATFNTVGHHDPDVLIGDFFQIDASGDSAQGQALINVDPAVGCDKICERHGLRFMVGAFDAGTELFLWTLEHGAASEDGFLLARYKIETTFLAFDMQGRLLGAITLDLMPLERLQIADLGLPEEFGWLDVTTSRPSFMAVRYGAFERFSVGLKTFCLPPAEGGIRIEKHTNGEDADVPSGPSIPVGDPVEWTYRVWNTGTVTLTDVGVSDNRGVDVDCPRDTLEPGETMTCTAQGVAEACQYSNLGQVSGITPEGQRVTDFDRSHYFGQVEPAIDVEKRTNGEDADTAPGPALAAGADVEWTYVVTNTGDVALENVSLDDDQIGSIACPQTALEAGASMTCTASGTAIDGGLYRNVGTVTGISSRACGAVAVADSDASHYTVTPLTAAIHLEKLTNGEDADTPTGPRLPLGADVTWTYVVTNIGNATLTDITVDDDVEGPVTDCDARTLDPRASTTCRRTGTMTTPGQYRNMGTATGKAPDGQQVEDDDPSHCYGYEDPGIDLEKHTNGSDSDVPPGATIATGAPVEWTYLVSNTGNVPLSDVSVSDDQLGAISCPKNSLDIGESMTCTAGGAAVCGQYANVGTVNGLSPTGTPVTNSDPSHYFGESDPAIRLVKYVQDKDGNWVNVGSCDGPIPDLSDRTVRWKFEVTNNGNVPLYDIQVLDGDFGGVVCSIADLEPGASSACYRDGTVDNLKCHCRCNDAEAIATGPCGTQVSDADRSCYYK